ncbi:MAG TPA: carboxymuconolactone decarboxylase family protein [Segeticoccus sp.]|uniref:carboxymuconolactone decarboxylase family protein n=1 Tax=Segeticoccus sp. TaxID=2706531 RepID=UPI002D808D97|nr:carboxymuconolactone decarboxylase family protein [Segeticoccus sp.]HET8600664.1 carboxymuconolactone decarboxylase family protein [Segeticoccus sp.]
MTARLNLQETTPDAYRRMGALEQAAHQASSKAGIPQALYHLVKVRASQLNGCAFCLDMHTKEARADGEDEQRLYTISAWRETSFFSEQERAALALAEQVTRISEGGVSDEVWAQAEKQFNAEQLSALIWAIVAINSWNRMAISTRSPEPGSYQPQGASRS